MTTPYPALAAVPLAYLQPVGLSPVEASAIMAAANGPHSTLCWNVPPTGIQPDVYLAHLRTVDLEEDCAQPLTALLPDRYPPRLAIDDRGLHQGRPVCLVGGHENTHLAWAPHTPGALAELHSGLRDAGAQLTRQRIHYALGREAWLRRHHWSHQRLQLHSHGQLMAVIDPAGWRIALRRGATAVQVEQAAVDIVAASAGLDSTGMEVFPLELALWTLARRCNESALPELLPSGFLRARLARWNPLPQQPGELDDNCQAIWSALDAHPMSAAELRRSLKLPEPVLLRALACMALSRVIRAAAPEAQPVSRRALSWLPSAWRQSLFRDSRHG